jgi:hypothetical protein
MPKKNPSPVAAITASNKKTHPWKSDAILVSRTPFEGTVSTRASRTHAPIIQETTTGRAQILLRTLGVILSRRTSQISDPALLIFDCQPERNRRVRCIWLVRRFDYHGCHEVPYPMSATWLPTGASSGDRSSNRSLPGGSPLAASEIPDNLANVSTTAPSGRVIRTRRRLFE